MRTGVLEAQVVAGGHGKREQPAGSSAGRDPADRDRSAATNGST
jgi:hypothetical protein